MTKAEPPPRETSRTLPNVSRIPGQVDAATVFAARGEQHRLSLDLHAALVASMCSATKRGDGAAAVSDDKANRKRMHEEKVHSVALKACRRVGAWRRASAIATFVAFGEPFNTAADPFEDDHAVALDADPETRDGTLSRRMRIRAMAEAMSACVRARDTSDRPVLDALESALHLFDRAESAGFDNRVIYGNAMQAHILAGRREQASDLHARAVRQGIEFTVVENNIAIGAAARCDRLDVALALLESMRADGSACRPDVGTYDAVLPRVVSAGRHDEVVRLFDCMDQDELEPLEYHYRIAIGACASLGQGGRAAALLLQMQDKGMAFTSAAADTIFACNKADMHDVALDIFEAVRFDKQLSPGKWDAAAGDAPVRADLRGAMFVYNGALDAFRRSRDAPSAVEMLVSMGEQHGVTPDVASYSTALAACRAADRHDLVIQVLSAIARRGAIEDEGWVASDCLHAELMRSFSAAGQPRRALRLYAQLLRASVPTTSHMYNSLLSAVCKEFRSETGLGKPPPLAWDIMAQGMATGVWGQPTKVSSAGEACIDLSAYATPASLMVATHYWLRHLSRTLRAHSAGSDALSEVLLIASPPEAIGRGRLRMISENLTRLDIPHEEAYDAHARGTALRLAASSLAEPSLFARTSSATDLARKLAEEEEDPLAAAGRGGRAPPTGGSGAAPASASPDELCTLIDEEIGPSTDAIDAVIDQLESTFAPLEAWHTRAVHLERRAANKAYVKRWHHAAGSLTAEDDEDEVLSQVTARLQENKWRHKRSGVSWPAPLAGADSGASRWSTPRPWDRRQRDGVHRAPRSTRPTAAAARPSVDADPAASNEDSDHSDE